MRVNARVAGVVAAATLLRCRGLAYGAELPRGPVTAQTVASAQAEATAAATASTDAARAGRRGRRRARRRQGRRDGRCRRQGRRRPDDPANIAAAAAASAAQADRAAELRRQDRRRRHGRRRLDRRRRQRLARGRVVRASSTRGTSTEGTARSPDDTALPPTTTLHSDNVDARRPRPRQLRSTVQRRQVLPGVQPEQVPGLLGAELPALREPRLRRHGRQRHRRAWRLVAQGPGAPEVHRLAGHRVAQIGAMIRTSTADAVLGGREHDGRQPSQARLHVASDSGQQGHHHRSTSRTRGTRCSIGFQPRAPGPHGDLPQRLPLHLVRSAARRASPTPAKPRRSP